jgi:hypothetical protein
MAADKELSVYARPISLWGDPRGPLPPACSADNLRLSLTPHLEVLKASVSTTTFASHHTSSPAARSRGGEHPPVVPARLAARDFNRFRQRIAFVAGAFVENSSTRCQSTKAPRAPLKSRDDEQRGGDGGEARPHSQQRRSY